MFLQFLNIQILIADEWRNKMTYVKTDHVNGGIVCPMLPSGGRLSKLHEVVSMAFVATRPSSTGDALRKQFAWPMSLFCSMRVGPGSMLQGSFWSFNDQGSDQLWSKASYSLVTFYYGFAGIDWNDRLCDRMFVVNFEFLTRFCLPLEAQGQYQYCGCCNLSCA